MESCPFLPPILAAEITEKRGVELQHALHDVFLLIHLFFGHAKSRIEIGRHFRAVRGGDCFGFDECAQEARDLISACGRCEQTGPCSGHIITLYVVLGGGEIMYLVAANSFGLCRRGFPNEEAINIAPAEGRRHQRGIKVHHFHR